MYTINVFQSFYIFPFATLEVHITTTHSLLYSPYSLFLSKRPNAVQLEARVSRSQITSLSDGQGVR